MVTREISGQPVPKVSLCIPVYNGARFLAETMRSALAQDYADFELVVSDNASTDETPQVVAGFDDPRIVYSRSERNLGPVGNFNRCLELARGRYTKILCADDLLYPTCLSRQVAILEEDAGQAISLVSCARDIIDADSRVRWRSRPANFRGHLAAPEAIRRSAHSGTNLFGEPQAVLFRTAQGRQAGGFNPAYSFCLDLDFWFRLLALGDLYRIEESLCAFRVSQTSWSTGLSRHQAAEYHAFLGTFARQGHILSPADVRRGSRQAILNAYFRRLFYLWLALPPWTPRASRRNPAQGATAP